MPLPTLLSSLLGRPARHRPGPSPCRRAVAPRRSCAPRLDALGDRALPSVFSVTTLADGGLGALRQSLVDANATPGDDTITFEVTGTIQLAGALPNPSSNIELHGPGAANLTVRRQTGGSYRIFTLPGGATVNISGLTITNGVSASEG